MAPNASRPLPAAERAARSTRLVTVVLVWAGGLGAGIYALVAAVARYGCAPGHHGLACRGSGSATGFVVVALALAVVTAVTLLTAGRRPRVVLIAGLCGLVALGLCAYAARSLLATT